MRRRVISAALALCMMLTLLPGTALAVDSTPLPMFPRAIGPTRRWAMSMKMT